MTDEYRVQLVRISDGEAAALHATRLDNTTVQVQGPCPHCTHLTTDDVPVAVLMLGAGENVPAGGGAGVLDTTRKVDCKCTGSHDKADGARGCGASWLVRLVGTAGDLQVRAGDYALAEAADALDAAAAAQETRLAESAKAWGGYVTALLGLLGLAGVVVGKDTVGDLDGGDRTLLAVLLALAVAAAVAATYFATLGATGWLRSRSITTDADLVAHFGPSGTWRRVQDATDALRISVIAATLAVAFLTIAVLKLWSVEAPAPTAKVRIALADGSTRCGDLLSPTPQIAIRLRDKNGAIVNVPANRIRRIAAVNAC